MEMIYHCTWNCSYHCTNTIPSSRLASRMYEIILHLPFRFRQHVWNTDNIFCISHTHTHTHQGTGWVTDVLYVTTKYGISLIVRLIKILAVKWPQDYGTSQLRWLVASSSLQRFGFAPRAVYVGSVIRVRRLSVSVSLSSPSRRQTTGPSEAVFQCTLVLLSNHEQFRIGINV